MLIQVKLSRLSSSLESMPDLGVDAKHPYIRIGPLIYKFSATSQSVSHSAALKSATYGLALVTRITAGSETLENHVYDGF